MGDCNSWGGLYIWKDVSHNPCLSKIGTNNDKRINMVTEIELNLWDQIRIENRDKTATQK